MAYAFQEIEKKWQKYWQEHPYGAAQPAGTDTKYYCLDMFPYPSGSGLHVGHWRGYTLSDVYARIKKLQGCNVLHPMGWDAFGLPAENDAIKKGIHPQINTQKNIETFKRQLAHIGAMYDWSKELNTTDPAYYKWTQWIFIQMFKAGLAYQSNIPINWCTSCLTGLANEEVVNGSCERCGSEITQKKIPQWVLKITAYAEQLLNDLDTVDWPEKVKVMQRNWIGKSEGLLFTAPVKDADFTIQTFSAHFETFMADTFVVIAPDHQLLPKLIESVSNKVEIQEFCNNMIEKRLHDGYEETEPEGIFTGRYIEDPVSGTDLPIWVASFAIADYGTGIIKCSAHDQRDFDFAKKYNIPLKVVLLPPDDTELAQKVQNLAACYTDMQNGILTEPPQFTGKRSGDVREEIIQYCIDNGFAVRKTSYRLRDWIFSRQRYWGEPIPLIHCGACGVVPVPEDQLPVMLPDVKKYQPTGTGESPLAAIDDWVNVTCPACNGPAKRETNTMPQWAGSSWYFLRYPNPHLANKPFDQEDMNYWLPVDLYVGGIEHAILHLLYARFYTKFLHDQGYLPFNEPFTQLFNQGMITKYSELTKSVEKMSKSKGNVVNPDDIVAQYGSDVLRVYMLFMGPPELDCQWQDTGLEGVKRFLNRLWDYLSDPNSINEQQDYEVSQRLHQFLKKFQERIEQFKPNTAISAFMEWLNYMTRGNHECTVETAEAIIVSLSVIAPHMASELYQEVSNRTLDRAKWPEVEESLAREDEVTMAIQVNGKTRGQIEVKRNELQEEVEFLAKQEVAKWLTGKTIKKVIFVPNRLINLIV